MKKMGLFAVITAAVLVIVGEASGQDPGLQDSMRIGNLDGSIIPVGLNQEVVLPVWVKTDDSITFVHIPLASDNDYIIARLEGDFYPPFSLWDDVEFLSPDGGFPEPDMTSHSILGFAYLEPPRDPQNFLMTNYEWWYIADFVMIATSSPDVLGDTICLVEGFSPSAGGLLWILQDGVTQIVPQAVYPCLFFSENMPPEFSEPSEGSEFNINREFPIEFDVIATDSDGDIVGITVEFPSPTYEFEAIEIEPGYSMYNFRWTPDQTDDGVYSALFTADDGNGGIAELHVNINVSPSILEIVEISGLPCQEIAVPVNLHNDGISSYVGGFEILLQYTEDMIHLDSVSRSDRIEGWDYFNYIPGDSSTLRIVGLANLSGDGQYLPPGNGPIAIMHFQIDGSDIYMGHYAEINFIISDYTDNAISDTTGYILIHPELDSGWVYIMDPDEIIIGDINLNSVPWEIADAVLYANHLINPSGFPFNPIQVLASDTNRDGIPETVPDLVYLINVLNGDIIPPR